MVRPMRDSHVHSILPCVVEIGFAGSRRLFGSSPSSQGELDAWHRQLEDQVAARLKSLHGDLALDQHYFFCGVSQIAAGADVVFAGACKRLNIPQRIFLPQPRDVYLAAGSANGEGDFSPEQRAM